MRPLVPEDHLQRSGSAAARSFVRACCALVLATRDENPTQILKGTWPRDALADTMFKAAVGPAGLATADLTQTVKTALLRGLAPASASAALFARAIQLNFPQNAATLLVPGMVMPAAS